MSRRLRLLLALVVAPLLLLLLGGAGLVVWRLPLAEWALRSQLPSLGLPRVEGKVRALDTTQLVLEDLVVEDEQARVERVIARFTPGLLLSGRLDTLTLERPTLRGSLEGMHPRFPLLEALLSEESASGDGAPPLNRLEIKDGMVLLDSPRGPLSILTNARFTPREEAPGWLARVSSEATGPGLTASGQAEARVTPEGTIEEARGGLTGSLAAFSLDGLVRDLSLRVDLTGAFDGSVLRAESPDLTLSIAGLAPELTAALPAPLAPLFEGPLSLGLGSGGRSASLTLPLVGEAGDARMARMARMDGPFSLSLGDPSRGLLSVIGTADLTLPGAPERPDPMALSGGVTATLALDALPLPGLAERVEGAVILDLALDGAGGLAVTLEPGGTLQARGLSPSLASPLAKRAPEWVEAPRLTIGPEPLTIARGGDNAWTLAGAAALTSGPDSEARITLDSQGITLLDGQPDRGSAKATQLTLNGISLAGVADLGGTLALSQAQWDGEGTSASLEFDLRAGSVTTAEATATAPHPRGALTLSREGAETPWTLDIADMTATLASLTLPDQGTALRDLSQRVSGTLTLDPGTALLSAHLDRLNLEVAGGSLAPDARLTAPLALSMAAPASLTANLDSGSLELGRIPFAPLSLALETPAGPARLEELAMTLSGPWPPLAGSPPTLEISGGRLRVAGVQARELGGRLSYEPAGPLGDLSALVDRLPGETSAPRGTRPLTLDLSMVHPDPTDDPHHFPLRARLRDPKGHLSLGLDGWARPDLSEGRLTLAARPVTFAAEGLQPTDLYGGLGDTAKAVSGTLALKGTVNWAKGRLKPNLSILAQDVTATLGDVPLEGVNGIIRINQFWPPRGPSQEVSVGTVRLGLPLSNALIRYNLDGAGNLVIEQASLDLAQGRIETADITVPLEGGQVIIPLTVESVALSELAGLTKLDGLAASGTLGGVIPLRVEHNGSIWVDKANLETDSPGLLSYRPPEDPNIIAAGNEGVLLLLLALDNFHYERLGLTLDGDSSGELAIGISILGANPELYDGYPVDLRVNLTGALTELIRENLRTYTLPDRIQENLDRFMETLGYSGATAPHLTPSQNAKEKP